MRHRAGLSIISIFLLIILALFACTSNNPELRGTLQNISAAGEVSILTQSGEVVKAQSDADTVFENNGAECAPSDLPPGSLVSVQIRNGVAVSVREYADDNEDERTTTPPPTTSINGAQLYSYYCARCHSATPPGYWRTDRTAAQLASAINSGPGKMPAFSDTLTTTQLSAIIQYIQGSTAPPTTTITVPVAEHQGLTWQGASTCLECHLAEAQQMFGAVHYQWKGQTPNLVNGPDIQGKDAGSFNAFCINILGNWGGCGACHPGLGAEPEAIMTPAQLANIDCLVCHQQAYKRIKVGDTFVPDTAAMTISMDQAAQTVHLPVRTNCVFCHARSGGGDAFKRGDLTLAHANTNDQTFDAHMSTTGANLQCIDCHNWEAHHVPGRGADLRPSDLPTVPLCTNCHADKATSSGHDDEDVNRHVDKLACQTCHIPIYGKDAADTPATEATEVHRTWLQAHASGTRFEPLLTLQNNVMPVYRFWNKTSTGYTMGDIAVVSQDTGNYGLTRPLGSINDPNSKLYPFKYKTAEQPMTLSQLMIALNTRVFFATGDAPQAISSGLINMGLSPTEPYNWVITDEFLMLNHEVSPRENALTCDDCHESNTRMNLSELGYVLKGPRSAVCIQCHELEDEEDFLELHEEHREEDINCSYCHGFSR